jgi:hypothetical protein
VANTKLKRFTKALVTWLQSDSTLKTATSFNASTNISIFIARGDDIISSKIPALIAVWEDFDHWLPDNDHVYTSRVNCAAIGTTRIESLDIAGAMEELARQNKTTYKDASFSTDNITTKGIQMLPSFRMGRSEYDPDSVRRTERSDLAIPERHITIIPLVIRWIDTE